MVVIQDIAPVHHWNPVNVSCQQSCCQVFIQTAQQVLYKINLEQVMKHCKFSLGAYLIRNLHVLFQLTFMSDQTVFITELNLEFMVGMACQ